MILSQVFGLCIIQVETFVSTGHRLLQRVSAIFNTGDKIHRRIGSLANVLEVVSVAQGGIFPAIETVLVRNESYGRGQQTFRAAFNMLFSCYSTY